MKHQMWTLKSRRLQARRKGRRPKEDKAQKDDGLQLSAALAAI